MEQIPSGQNSTNGAAPFMPAASLTNNAFIAAAAAAAARSNLLSRQGTPTNSANLKPAATPPVVQTSSKQNIRYLSSLMAWNNKA